MKRAVVVVAVFLVAWLALLLVPAAVSAGNRIVGSLRVGWYCRVTPAYGNPRATSADCWTATPVYTRGYVSARQTCATSSGQYVQTGPVKVAPTRNGWTGVSTTPSCPGYVVARWYVSDVVPSYAP